MMNRREITEAMAECQQSIDAVLPSILIALANAWFPRVLEDPFSIDGDPLKLLKYWTVADLNVYQAHNPEGAPAAMLLAAFMQAAGLETIGDYWAEIA